MSGESAAAAEASDGGLVRGLSQWVSGGREAEPAAAAAPLGPGGASDAPGTAAASAPSPARTPEGGGESDPVAKAHHDFLGTLSQHMSPERVKRMDSMMREFERRMGDRAYERILAGQDRTRVQGDIEKAVSGTFNQLDQLVATPKGDREVYNQKIRTSLAENFMLHAADPTTYDQGYHGSCWMEAGTIANGWTNHPDDLARFVKEVSLTGSFTSNHYGREGNQTHTFQFDPRLFAIGREEGGWSMESAERTSARSPVGMILDEGQSRMLGRRSSWGGTYGETARSQYWITGDVPANTPGRGDMRRTLLEKGAFINYWPGHMLTQQLRREGDHWVHIQDNQHGERSDYVLGRINDLAAWDYRREGRQGVQHFVPGTNPGDGPIGQYMPDPSVGPASALERGEQTPWAPSPSTVGPAPVGPGPAPLGRGGLGAVANGGSVLELLMLLYLLVQMLVGQQQGQTHPMIGAMLSGPNGPALKNMLGMIR